MKRPLSPAGRRADLTDRECASLIGGLIGALVQNSDVETVRNAVTWWAETDEVWEPLRQMAEAVNLAARAGGQNIGST